MDVRTLIDRPESTVALVVNTNARQGALALDRAERLVLEHPPASLRSHAAHSGAELVATLDRVMADAPDVLVVGGGDGTVSCAAARVAGTSTVLVVLPLRSGRFVEHERVHHLTTRRVRVVTDDPMPINLDGELLATTPAEFTVERNAVRVAVPRGSRAARLDDAA